MITFQTWLIRRMGYVLAPETQYLICFEHDQMPLLWKLAKISILFKSGDRFDVKTYRPVAVLPAMSKGWSRHIMSLTWSAKDSLMCRAHVKNGLTMEAAILYMAVEVYGLGIESVNTDNDDLNA